MAFTLVLCLICLPLSLSADTDEPFNYNIRLLKSRAELGNRVDQFILGKLYLRPNAITGQDIEKGQHWLKQSATRGHTDAQQFLADMLFYGEGVKKDHAGAFYWYQQAARRGRTESQEQLARFYQEGLGGVERDYFQARQWLRRAAKGGSLTAESNLVWLLATCPDERIRDGRQAIIMAMDLIARKGQRHANDLDNLAAAYAETGDFRNAIRYQRQAMELLDEKQEVDRLKRFQKRLQLYQSGKKYRDE